jgi:hypothetical protein
MVRELKLLCPEITVSVLEGTNWRGRGWNCSHHYRDKHHRAMRVSGRFATFPQEDEERIDEADGTRLCPVDFPDVNLRLCKIARAGFRYATTSALKSGHGDGRIRKITPVTRMMTIFL